jgi:hypothetical protein
MFKFNRGEKVTYNKGNEKYDYEKAIREMIDIIESTANQSGMTLKELADKSGHLYLEHIKDYDYSDIQKHTNLWEVIDFLGVKPETKKVPAYK